jgi:hypothetical protein
MIKSIYGDDVIYASKVDAYGGVDINIHMTEPHKANLRWLAILREEYETEKRLRESHPAIQKAWEQYQVIKTLTQKEKENVI